MTMVEAKCCNCGALIKAPEPKGPFRYVAQCKSCGTRQFLEQLPGMEFFATLPFSLETTTDIDGYFVKMGFKDAIKKFVEDKPQKTPREICIAKCAACSSLNEIVCPVSGATTTKFACIACGQNNFAVQNKKGDIHIHLQNGKKEKDYASIGAAIGAVVSQKQRQYGNQISSMGPILRELYPEGVKPEQYNDLTLIVRILDKIGRISKGNGEGGEDAWGDIAGYAILGKANVQNR